MAHRRLFFIANVVAILSLLLQGGIFRAGQSTSDVILEGTFIILWGDSKDGSAGSFTEYFLSTTHKEMIRLVISADLLDASVEIVGLNRQNVVVQGAWLDHGTTLSVQTINLSNKMQSAPQGVYGSQPWVSILCKFADYSVEPRDKNYFIGMYSSQYPGLDHFWRQNSYNLANLAGSGVFGWYVLPHPRNYYLPGGNLNWEAAAEDCTSVADPYVNFSPYVGINLMFNADLDCCAWGGSWYACLDGVCKYWRTTWEPPWGYESIGVIAHETGHGFGLPHSEGNCQKVYDNRWDVLSDVWSNGSDPIYGTMGQHTISYHKELLGWLTANQVYEAAVGTVKTITLEKLSLPQTNNYLGAVIPIDGQQNHFYTLEVRQPSTNPVDYDKWLPGFAVIIHEVTVGQPEPAVVIDQDGDCDTGDAGAMYTTGEMFVDTAHGIIVSINSASSTSYTVTINNRFKYMKNLVVSGAVEGDIDQSLPFTATVSPSDATVPITYTWQVNGMGPIVHVGGIQDTVDFSWDEVGLKTITVTATNEGGTLTDTHHINIGGSMPLDGVDILGPAIGVVQGSYSFSAQIYPITTTLPITYIWTIDSGNLITHTAGITDTILVSWETPGLHTLSVSASNPINGVSDAIEITIFSRVFLPLTRRN